MSLAEVEHPIGRELTTIVEAMDMGLADSEMLPEGLNISYVNAMETFSGASKIGFVDEFTENVGAIFVPVFTEDTKTFGVGSEDDMELTTARIKIMDVEGRAFPIGIGENDVPSPYLQFDVTGEGIVFSAEPNGNTITSYGVFESELYYSWFYMAGKHASISRIHQAAKMFLNAA